jgi:hypothetical protein
MRSTEITRLDLNLTLQLITIRPVNDEETPTLDMRLIIR